MIFLFLVSPLTHGYENDLRLFISQVEKEAEVYGDATLQKLSDYKKQVKKTAYKTTLELCEGYRRANKMGPTKYHKKYMYTEHEAEKAWLRIVTEGAKQAFGATYGALLPDSLGLNLKQDYIDTYNKKINQLKLQYPDNKALKKDYISWYNMEAWFGSLYVMYLLDSTEFLMGAMHCLEMNMMEMQSQRKIGLFAATIAIVDYEVALAGHAASFWSGGKLLGLIAKAGKFVLRPGARLVSKLNSRLKITKYMPKVGKKTFYASAITLASALIIKKKSKAKQQSEVAAEVNGQLAQLIPEMLEEENDTNQAKKMKLRLEHLNNTFNFFISLREEAQKRQGTAETCTNCEDLYLEFENHVKEKFNDELIQKMNSDRIEIADNSLLQEDELLLAYSVLLDAEEGFLSTVESFYKK